MIAEGLGAFLLKLLWAPFICILGYFVVKRDKKIDELEKELNTKIAKEDVKEVVDNKLIPVYSKIDQLQATNMENTLLLREVSSELKSLTKDMAVIIAINSYKNKEEK